MEAPESPAPTSIEPPKAACIYCRSTIERGATICSVCKSYQSQWRNGLTYFGGLAGFIALISSAITFVYVNVAEIIHRNLNTDKLSLLSLTYPGYYTSPDGYILVSNHGDNDLFLSDLVVVFKGEDSIGNFQIPIGITLKSNSVVNVKLTYRDDGQFKSSNSGGYINNKTGKPSVKTIKEAFRNDNSKCVHPYVYTINSPDVIRMNDYYKYFGTTLVTQPANVYLDVVSNITGSGSELQIENAVITFVAIKEFGCNPSEWVD